MTNDDAQKYAKRGRPKMRTTILSYVAVVALGAVFAAGAPRRNPKTVQAASDDRRKEIEAFNAKFLEAHLHMDTPAILGMWAEDGVSLLPETTPMIGKPAIANFLGGVTEQLKGWHMEKMEM